MSIRLFVHPFIQQYILNILWLSQGHVNIAMAKTDERVCSHKVYVSERRRQWSKQSKIKSRYVRWWWCYAVRYSKGVWDAIDSRYEVLNEGMILAWRIEEGKRLNHVDIWVKTILNKGIQFSSVAQSCLTLCDPMNCSTPGLPVHHQLPESTQTYVHWISDAIQPFHFLPSPSPPALNLSQHQGLFKWVSSSHQVAKLLEFQLQHQSFQWTPRTDLL